MLLNGAAKIVKTALSFPQFALIRSVTCVQLGLITILGNCGCVAVASFLGVPSALSGPHTVRFLVQQVVLQVGDEIVSTCCTLFSPHTQTICRTICRIQSMNLF
jgi:hypothetical protein